MSRPTHVQRVLQMREMLDARPFLTVKQLQQTFGVSRRTVYNDLSALADAGVPVYPEPRPGGETRWCLQRAAKKRTLTMTVGQILSLGLARMALSFLEGTDLHGELSVVLERLGHGLSPRYREFLAQLERKIAVVHFGPKSYADKVDILDDVLSCLLYDERVELAYRPPGERLRRHVVEPYTLLLHSEALYLIGHSVTRGELRTFAIDRVASSRRLRGERFVYPRDYDPQRVLDGCFGIIRGEGAPEEIEIVFDAADAPYVTERRWHPTQRFETLEDGRVRMRMSATGTIEILGWIVGRSGFAEIVRPRALRRRAAGLLARAARRHQS